MRLDFVRSFNGPWSYRRIAALCIILVGVIAPAVLAAVVSIQTIPSDDVIGYPYRIIMNVDSAVGPTNSIDHVKWRRKCADCGDFTVVSDPGSAEESTINASFGTKRWELTAYYAGQSDPNNPTPPPPTILTADYTVQSLTSLAWEFDPSDTARWADPYFNQNTYVNLIFKAKSGGVSIGPYAGPTVEERIFRSVAQGGNGNWSPWVGASDDLYWDSSIAGIVDHKRMPLQGTGSIPNGGVFDVAYQQIRLTFAHCCTNRSTVVTFPVIKITTTKVDGSNFKIGVSNPNSTEFPAPP